MPRVIIHHEGVYNEYTTVSDGPCWESGLTLEQLQMITKEEDGNNGLRVLEERLVRAHKKGTSCVLDKDLEDTVSPYLYREDMTVEEFIEKFMTI